MSEFDSIDLLNYATYGNEYDDEWEDIRAFIKSNANAQKELEELKKNLPVASKKRRDYIPERKIYPTGDENPQSPLPDEQKKSWWSNLLGG